MTIEDDASDGPIWSSSPDDLRSNGWAVAIHNEYRVNGEFHTFWLLTKDGRALKGEAISDALALDEVRRQAGLPIPLGCRPSAASESSPLRPAVLDRVEQEKARADRAEARVRELEKKDHNGEQEPFASVNARYPRASGIETLARAIEETFYAARVPDALRRLHAAAGVTLDDDVSDDPGFERFVAAMRDERDRLRHSANEQQAEIARLEKDLREQLLISAQADDARGAAILEKEAAQRELAKAQERNAELTQKLGRWLAMAADFRVPVNTGLDEVTVVRGLLETAKEEAHHHGEHHQIEAGLRVESARLQKELRDARSLLNRWMGWSSSVQELAPDGLYQLSLAALEKPPTASAKEGEEKCPHCKGSGGDGGQSAEGHWEFVCDVCNGTGKTPTVESGAEPRRPPAYNYGRLTRQQLGKGYSLYNKLANAEDATARDAQALQDWLTDHCDALLSYADAALLAEENEPAQAAIREPTVESGAEAKETERQRESRWREYLLDRGCSEHLASPSLVCAACRYDLFDHPFPTKPPATSKPVPQSTAAEQPAPLTNEQAQALPVERATLTEARELLRRLKRTANWDDQRSAEATLANWFEKHGPVLLAAAERELEEHDLAADIAHELEKPARVIAELREMILRRRAQREERKHRESHDAREGKANG